MGIKKRVKDPTSNKQDEKVIVTKDHVERVFTTVKQKHNSVTIKY